MICAQIDLAGGGDRLAGGRLVLAFGFTRRSLATLRRSPIAIPLSSWCPDKSARPHDALPKAWASQLLPHETTDSVEVVLSPVVPHPDGTGVLMPQNRSRRIIRVVAITGAVLDRLPACEQAIVVANDFAVFYFESLRAAMHQMHRRGTIGPATPIRWVDVPEDERPGFLN